MRALRIAAFVFIALVVVLGLAFAGVQTAPGKRLLASVISGAASSPGQQVRITGIDGFVPTDLHVARIEVADRTGPWLQVDDAKLTWSFASLFEQRLRIELLSATRIAVLRAPQEEKKDTAPSSSGGVQLPLGIDLQALRIDDLHLAAALGGLDPHWKIAGNADVAKDLGEIRAKLGADRLEGPKGRLTADVRVDRCAAQDRGRHHARRGSRWHGRGVVAAAGPARHLAETLGTGRYQRDGTAELTAKAGDQATTRGTLRWQPDGSDHRLPGSTRRRPDRCPCPGRCLEGPEPQGRRASSPARSVCRAKSTS